MALPSAATDSSFRISLAPLSIDDIYQHADCAANGAVVLMSGMVRAETQGRRVVALEYQAYEPMALKVFEAIAAQIYQTWTDVTRVVIHHRIGRLSVGDISVLVAIGSPHRAEAFAACQFAIDTLKHQAPIWKKEHWHDGTSTWVSISACEQGCDEPSDPTLKRIDKANIDQAQIDSVH